MSRRTDDTGFGGIKLTQETGDFCYGIDAVLLADMAAGGRWNSIADLGTNNGVIPLILSALTDADRLVGIELQAPPARLAAENVRANGLEDRIEIVNADVLDVSEYFEKGSFDAVVSNPPYTAKGTGIVNAGDALTAARHETTAGLDDFFKAAEYLLKDKGTFYMIHRPSRIVDISVSARAHSLEPKYLRFISPHEGEKPNLMLIEMKKNGGRELKLLPPLNVYGPDGEYTEDINKIYRRR